MNVKCRRGCGEKGILLHCWWECKLVQPLWRTVWRFLKKLEIELPYDPAIPLLGIHTEETRRERDTCTPMFIAALFIIARTWKQPRCPSADEWIRKLWFIYTMEYYSNIKMNTFESVLMRWMNLELITQSEVSQRDREGNGNPLQYSFLENPMDGGAWWAAVRGVTKSWTRLSDFTFTFHFHALEKEMETHSSVLAWRIPGTGEPGGLPSMGSHRVRHD